MGAPVHTLYEEYVWKLLKFLDIPFEIDRIVCFQCNGARFYWNSDQLPEMCLVGLHRMVKGSFCIPDVIIVDKRYGVPVQTHTLGYEHCKMSILRVDGEVHNKRRVKSRDKGQERELNRLKIPYFVSENDFWKWKTDRGKGFIPRNMEYNKIPAHHLDYLIGIWAQTLSESLYNKYNTLREIKATKMI